MSTPFPSAPRSLAGASVLVTGAASGMGRATAALFVAEGARVALADRDAQGVEAAAGQLRKEGGQAQAWVLDVADANQVARVVYDVATRLGGIDVVVNNAGVAAFAAIDDDAFEDAWTRALAVMLTGQQRTIRAALPWLRRSAAPRVVNIASTEALGATSRNSAYAAAKAGVTGLTRALAVELGRDGITVNCICPGPIETSMTSRIPEEDKRRFAHRRTALGRYGRAEEVAHMTLSLCLPAASYVTGVTLPVDGGLMARNA